MADESLRQKILDVIAGFDAIGDVETLAATVMPDHIHWLFCLGQRLKLGRVLARFKAETRTDLAAKKLEWQRDFFEHLLRKDEGIEDYGLYVFLNPYRAELVEPTRTWPGWHCPKPGCFEFLQQLNSDDTPPPEWIGLQVPETLMAGE